MSYHELCEIIGKMKTEMENVENHCFQKSVIFKHVLQGLKLINLVEMLVAAYGDGSWKLHVAVVEELMPVFLEFDSINYSRHALRYF